METPQTVPVAQENLFSDLGYTPQPLTQDDFFSTLGYTPTDTTQIQESTCIHGVSQGLQSVPYGLQQIVSYAQL
jgi:hypothetical protein